MASRREAAERVVVQAGRIQIHAAGRMPEVPRGRGEAMSCWTIDRDGGERGDHDKGGEK